MANSASNLRNLQVKHKVDDSYGVYVVKRNDGKTVRLCQLESLLRFVYTKEDDRLEVEIISKEGGIEDFTNELWQKGSIIWFSPIHPRIWEATCENMQAEKENQIAKEWIDKLPDITHERMKEEKADGRLIVIEMSGISVKDGQRRMKFL